ncbi:mesaconyl-C4 CoA hydratase [Rhodococcus sp. BP-149]|uniref:mesaconyl-C4 CoA hydratase n=1 Tax=unclassified Rhodococcus (in: high G+C Gram-positive bacteria) TaxID=192944 RepID=UPI001C9AAFDD|nr:MULTISPECIES: mesaconyl-C4 CoA hydratase [unclassified Rhodococcus (in: high G+C Gram-positive bacteria)]MBY6685610.1 mesaconyl-C4 CoA hydratase [Rhodococcus sp. BP-288]MBY6694842.1 mesaconyl-C4 CoA hydratase [Rhodococcus sp. BP-188]MBY6696688.1 mesaconyl-C4 CoA hydratase [Rhodococcus sp. BP-285]MBY6703344.1 mesaconyl-C4 CoA hydratase [Rhodococcus sp. BP-283]MBY6708667.1 mesaconyl-C4 CoA hydratase [Rhodococcus sp. BP-241]
MTSPDFEERTEVISAEPVESMAALLDIDVPHGLGDTVPPVWHWLYLLPRDNQRDLGEDGHPVTGIPAPPAGGRRRMFGGGRVTTFGSLRIGEPATKVTSIAKSVDKVGRTGPLTLTTVLQEISQGGRIVVREEQDIVYRAGGSAPLPTPAPAQEPVTGPTLSLDVDATLLFRFSALTYNAHRIHYDLDWCRREGYDGLVIHGPLLAFMMAEHMRRSGLSLQDRTFGYRLVSPMTRPQAFTVVPGEDGLDKGAAARSAAGIVCATSTVTEVGPR